MKKGEKPSATVLYLRVDPAFDSPAGVVVFHRPVFSKSDSLPKNKKDIETQAVESLRAVLEREAPEVARVSASGKHPRGGELDPDSFAVQAPNVVEIPLSPAAVTALQGKQLLVECELDGQSTPESAVHVQHAVGARPDAKFGANVELLLQPESKLAKDLTSSGERFCAAFPNRFFYVNADRGLAAGFHLVEGVFRDDQPLVNKVLTEAECRELDRLWKELDFVTNRTETLLRGSSGSNGPSVTFCTTSVSISCARKTRTSSKRKSSPSSSGSIWSGSTSSSCPWRRVRSKPQKPSPKFDMIHGFFEEVRGGLKEYKQTLTKAEEPALADLERLAQRAYSGRCVPRNPNPCAALSAAAQARAGHRDVAARHVYGGADVAALHVPRPWHAAAKAFMR